MSLPLLFVIQAVLRWNSSFCNKEDYLSEISKAVCPLGYISLGELLCMYFDLFLVCVISLPVAQLFVIIIESILRRSVLSLVSQYTLHLVICQQSADVRSLVRAVVQLNIFVFLNYISTPPACEPSVFTSSPF